MRNVVSIWKSQPTVEGAGVHLQRVFGQAKVPKLDPFLLLDDFSSGNPLDYIPGFPWHPHRGIETVTYMLDGHVKHEDSLGNKGTIGSGSVQWMSAGSGIIHQEMPQKSKQLTGFQLWVNLPSKKKMSAPQYQDISKAEIPEIDYHGAKVKIICGTVDKIHGPVNDIAVQPEYLDVSIPAGTTFTHPISKGKKVFAYTISGSGSIGTEHVKDKHLVLFNDHGDVQITATEDLRLLLVSGKPIGEEIAWYGPIVMNTQAELQKAMHDYRHGTFIQKKPVL